MRYEIGDLAALPLARIYALRKVWRRQGKADLVALAQSAIERRIAIVCGEAWA